MGIGLDKIAYYQVGSLQKQIDSIRKLLRRKEL